MPSSIVAGDVSISVVLTNISAMKLDERPPTGELTFDVGVRVEEKERKTDAVAVVFILTFKTKPSVVKFGIEGNAILTGRMSEIEKLLQLDLETKIPGVLNNIYQHVFTAIYLAATVLGTPYPPSDLFNSSKRTKPTVEMLSNASLETDVSPENTPGQQ